jgi:hypothetical protein
MMAQSVMLKIQDTIFCRMKLNVELYVKSRQVGVCNERKAQEGMKHAEGVKNNLAAVRFMECWFNRRHYRLFRI